MQELGERVKRLEAENLLYREAFIAVSERRGVEVPDFVRQESGGPGEGQSTRVDQLRQWMEEVLSEETVPEEGTATTTRSQSRHRGRGGDGGRGRGKRPRGGKIGEGGSEVI